MDGKVKRLPLWLPYTALSGWLMCFMRVCFRSTEFTGLLGRENILFIVLCSGIVLGMIVPLPDFQVNWRKNQTFFRASAIAAIPCTILAVNTLSVTALILTFLASFFASVALGCNLYRISLQLSNKQFGMFFGTAFAASEGLLLILLLFPLNRIVSLIAIALMCLLLLAAAMTYRRTEATAAQSDEPNEDENQPAKSLLRKYLFAMLLYCVIGGMLDNLTAFDDAFLGIPNMLVFMYLFSVPAHLILGALFHRFDWHKVTMGGILFICLGQSLSFFSSISALAIPYLALTTLGIICMEFLVRGLPTRYASGSPKPARVSRLGYAALYGGFLVTSVLFEFIPRSRYFFVLGIVLMLAFAVLSLLYIAASEEERSRHDRLMEELQRLHMVSADTNTAARDTEARLAQLGLTAREREACVLLLKAYSIKQIAVDLKIAYATANVHCTNLYRKLGISSRAELFQMFGVIAAQGSKDE